jgi:hypothetical protein
LLNGTTGTSSNIITSRLVTDDKPQHTDEDEASNSEEAWYHRLLQVMMVYFLWNLPTIKRKRNAKVKVSKHYPLFLRLSKLPKAYMVLTNTIALSMWCVGMCLSTLQMKWAEYNKLFGPKLQFMRRRNARKPPDPKNKWESFLQEFTERQDELGKKRSLFDRIFNIPPSSKRKRYMLLALNAAIVLARKEPTILLSDIKLLQDHLRKYKRNGFLLAGKINNNDIRLRLRTHIIDEPVGLLTKNGDFDLIIDTGCTKTATGFIEDFLPNTLQNLDRPIRMDGIAGGLDIKKQGKVRYEIVDDRGSVQELIVDAYHIPGLGCRLFSPQDYFRQQKEDGHDPEDVCSMVVKQDKSVIKLANDSQISIYYDSVTHLPRVRAYKFALQSATALALNGCVTEESNQNLSPQQKILLKWHFRLGHLGFATTQWLGRNGMLGQFGEKMGAARLQAPKCAACQFGKQGRTPIQTQHGDKDATGSLTKNKLEPGQLVFADQYESRQPGRAFTTKGMSSSSHFTGGTLFVDAASNYVYVSHQMGSTANETIQSKVKFEREAMTCGVTIQAYHTENGVFTSKEFMRELAEKGQGIKFSGVSAQFQNGAAENAIKIVVRNARTMMIHATLRWPGFVEKGLWPMALSHAAYLYNVTPKMETGVSPISVFTKTMQESNSLRNLHTWGCPVYVLTPKLKDGQKIPKWEPRSRRGQFVGHSPMHASTVGLIRNLQTGSITPQFHLVYDDYFETVHSRDDQEPESWNELLRFNRFQTDFDADVNPNLPDEWLNPIELQERNAQRQEARENIMARTERAPIAPNDVDPIPQVPVAPMVNIPQQPPLPIVNAPQPVLVPPIVAPIVAPQRRPIRVRNPPERFINQHAQYYTRAAGALCVQTARGLVSCSIGYESDYRYMLALLTDVDSGHMDSLCRSIMEFQGAFKATPGKDPDLPTYREAMAGPDRELYEEAMTSEIKELENHDTWKLVDRNSVPQGAKVLPSTWVLRTKRYPDGRLRKHKARFCVRGDQQIEGIDYTDKYSPVVAWSTVRMLLTLSIYKSLYTRQVDFSNAFVQAKLKDGEHIYVDVPKGFENNDSNEHQVLKLNRSLYGLVQASLYWGNHLKKILEDHGLTQSQLDPCMYCGDGVICLTYVDDCLFFGNDQRVIDRKIKSIQDSGLKLTVEDDIFAFLGVELVRKDTGEVELRQRGLIDKVLLTCGMTDCNTKATPCNQIPLGTNPEGDPVSGKFEYASAVGMLMYLSSNSRPDIQYAVHQCARFTHFPKKTHEDAILRICRYLQGTKDKGLIFQPTDDMTLDCYVDADFAGLYGVEDDQDPVCVKSRTGYCLTLGGCPLIWVSKLQTEIALSTTEAEYIALSQSLRDLIPMRRLLQEASQGLSLTVKKNAILYSKVFEDNNGALSIAQSPRMSPRTKHIAIKYHHFCNSIGEEKGIILEKIDTTKQKADILTKGLPGDTHVSIRKLLMGW